MLFQRYSMPCTAARKVAWELHLQFEQLYLDPSQGPYLPARLCFAMPVRRHSEVASLNGDHT